MSAERAQTRVAIVGCGGIAKSHAAAIGELEDLELAAVVDTDPAALAAAEEAWHAPGYGSVGELLSGPTIDVACICTPPATHRALAEEFLGAGVDVLCEKPLATSVEDAEAMILAAERAGRKLAVSDKFRHVADLVEAGRRIEAGEIGRPMHYAVSFCAPVDVRGRWPSDPALSGGGVLMDNGPHAFDVLSHVLDAPIAEVKAVLGEPVLAPPVEDTAELLFRTESGTTGRIELSWAYFTKDLDYLVVQGTEGTIRVGWTGGQIRKHGEREWTSFGSGYDKKAAFRGVWGARQVVGPSGFVTNRAGTALLWLARAYGQSHLTSRAAAECL